MTACNCPEKKIPIESRNWEILQYRCNHSAFNGYHWTASDYSAIRCCSCGSVWRTKALYVHTLGLSPLARGQV